jgi:hypothetical protein
VDYRNVKKSAPDLDEMLRHSKGQRKVPVIVEDATVSHRVRRDLRGLTGPVGPARRAVPHCGGRDCSISSILRRLSFV